LGLEEERKLSKTEREETLSQANKIDRVWKAEEREMSSSALMVKGK